MAKPPPPVPEPGTFKAKLVNAFVRANVSAYRMTGGRVGGTMAGAPVLLLDHVGRKSGKARTTALIYAREGDNLVIIGSRGGSEAMPAWWFNLQAKPETTVQVGRDKLSVVAREAVGEERERLWKLASGVYPFYDDYQARTDRVIPVIVLEKAA